MKIIDHKHYIFFRDDDVKKMYHKFLKLFRLFQKNEIPVVYGVIPGRLEKRLVKFLNTNKKEHPHLFDIAQHGWLHKNYAPVTHSQGFEFGSRRTYAEQKKDILRGCLSLSKEFKDNFDQIFIPPYHGYDFTTLKIINQLGKRDNLKIFSAGKKTFPKEKNFLDIPAVMNFAPPKQHKQYYLSCFLRELWDKFNKNQLIGILLHHDEYDKNDLDLLKKMLVFLKKQKNLAFSTLSHLARNKKKTKFDLTFEVTNRCNLRCRVCNIWQEKTKNELTLDNIRLAIAGLTKNFSLGNISLTGGEPFLNPEFDGIFRYLMHAKAKKQIDSIGIYTNGFALETIISFLKKNSQYLEFCELGVSLDGLSTKHDYLRGKKGAYARATGLLRQAKREFPQLDVSAKFTISPVNFKDLPFIYRFCIKNNIPLLPKLAESNTKFYYHRVNTKECFDYDFNKDQKTELRKILSDIRDLEISRKKNIVDPVVLDCLIRFITTGKYISQECYTPLYTLFFTSGGGIHPCLYQPAIANLNKKRWVRSIMNHAHFKIIENAICGICPKCFSYHGFLKNVNLNL